MAWRMNVFCVEQLLVLRIVLLISVGSANGITDIPALIGREVRLSCSLPLSNQTDVIWEVGIYTNERENPYMSRVAQCSAITAECSIIVPGYHATISGSNSALIVTPIDESQLQVYCLLGSNRQETYIVRAIETPAISPPNCSIIPTTYHEGRDTKLTFSCESRVPSELPYYLSLFGVSGNISKRGISELNIVSDVDGENFTDSLNVVCQLGIANLNMYESCSFPHSIEVTYTPDVTDAVFDCQVDSGVDVTWRLLDPKGREEDMTVRSWTSNGGSSLLIKNIGKQDLGKVAECRINGSVGFGVIYGIGSSGNDPSNGSTQTYASHGDRLVYVVLTFIFGGLLLLTLLIIISHWSCGACNHPMKWYTQFTQYSKPKTSTTNQLSGSIENNSSEGGSNSRGPGRDVVTIPESNLNGGNQNNSAQNHPRDPTPKTRATSNLVAGASSSIHPDQPVIDTNQHTYFCVERSTPPPSLPDLSTSGSVTIYQDPDYEESQRQRLRDSAGYDVVDASKKQMNNNSDMDDYAEVGGAFDMTRNPAIASRSSKGWTGKGVMSSDPAVLYGKVKK